MMGYTTMDENISPAPLRLCASYFHRRNLTQRPEDAKGKRHVTIYQWKKRFAEWFKPFMTHRGASFS